MNSINRIAQLLAAFVGVIGAYFTVITLVTMSRAFQAGAGLIMLVTLPMLVVGAVLLVFSYRAAIKPTESSSRHVAAVYSIIVLLYSDIFIKPMLADSEIVINPEVVASGSSIVLAVIVYYGIKMLLNKTSKPQAAA